ncbi:MAG: CusA/CzcA family heavy metal efflux RND transporter [Nitrospiraceae bacterium]|nr:CusA/CzcA family heavy metal efflux RND transporter [Nitrospiraceae bacterium]
MIRKIIELSAKNRLMVFILFTFLIVWGILSLEKTPLDAIPDLSDTQVIVYTKWTGRSPDLVEDQVTYPITSTLLAAPKVQAVRGFSFLGTSFVYVIFKEGTDIYWARSRVLEYLQSVKSKLPAGASPELGPDATGVGWGFEYALVDDTGGHDLSQLRSMQDWNVKLALESVPGVAEVASVGGFVKQYQVNVDPDKLLAYNVPLTSVLAAVRQSNLDVEGSVLDLSGREYMVRGRGYIKNLDDLRYISVGRGGDGTPIYLKDVATVELGPKIRRGVADLDGKGEVAGGIVVVRFGENVAAVINRVKQKIKKDIAPSLPKGVRIVTTYDRSDLIKRSIATLKDEIIKLSIAVSLVCLIFLFHLPSALVVILTLPIAILIAFICMYYLGVTSNIMSLSGIAIAIGAMVDASIIMVENAHKKLEEWEGHGPHGGGPGLRGEAGRVTRAEIIIEAAKEVGPSLFFSLLVITAGFLPVFALQQQAGRLFKPLAYTKTFAMLFSSFIAITLTPVLMSLFIRGKVRPERENPVSRLLHRIYEPVASVALRHKKLVILAAVVILALTVIPYKKLGSEFMPPLYEGTILYMPVTLPGASVGTSSRLLQLEDKMLKEFPEVSSVFGKAGRADTATDPAPLEMFETVVNLKPEDQWPKGMTVRKLEDQMNNRLQIPGVSNDFTMPIKARVDMLATGIRTPLGIKIMGPDLNVIDGIGQQIQDRLKGARGLRSVYAERAATGYFLDIDVDRAEAARYGLSVEDVQDIIQSAIGGADLTTTVEGRERYPVNVRYKRELRGNIDAIKRVLVPVAMPSGGPVQVFSSATGIPGASMPGADSAYGGGGSTVPGITLAPDGYPGARPAVAQVPLGELADIKFVKGPSMIKSEAGFPVSYVYIDYSGSDIGGFIKELQGRLKTLSIPPGYHIQWSGEYQYMEQTAKRLKLVIPLTILLIFVLIYLNTKSAAKSIIVLLAVPFSLVGSFWFLYLLHYNMSTAVWVGLIALAGLDAETGVVMLLYLDLAFEKWRREGRLKGREDLKSAVMEGAVKRIRPKIMTVSVILAGLIPVMFSHGAGSDVMKRIAAPMVGGVVTSTLLELIIYPAIYMLWKERRLFGGNREV